MVHINNYNRLVGLIRNHTVVGCGKCKTVFDDEAFEYAIGTGECCHCHEEISVGLTNFDTSKMSFR